MFFSNAVCVCMCVHVCACTHVHACVCVCVHACMCVCVCVCILVCVCDLCGVFVCICSQIMLGSWLMCPIYFGCLNRVRLEAFLLERGDRGARRWGWDSRTSVVLIIQPWWQSTGLHSQRQETAHYRHSHWRYYSGQLHVFLLTFCGCVWMREVMWQYNEGGLWQKAFPFTGWYVLITSIELKLHFHTIPSLMTLSLYKVTSSWTTKMQTEFELNKFISSQVPDSVWVLVMFESWAGSLTQWF